MKLLPIPKKLTSSEGQCDIALNLPDVIDIDCAPIKGIEEQTNLSLGAQAFHLLITSTQITLSFSDQLGRLYGLNLIKQISEQYPLFPCLEIEDSPDYLNRGIILDISRDKVPKLGHLFSLIDLWARLRINKLQLYTEHTFAYEAHQTVWQHSSPYNGDDIRKIDRYCQRKGIELVINQATFGHMERWLQHDDYKYLAEQTSGFMDQRGDFRPFSFGLNPLGETSADFVDRLLDELVPHFSSQTININFDETMDLGVGVSRDACAKLGKGEVYVSYLNKLLQHTEKRGLHTQIFSDMLFHYPEIQDKLPRNLTLLNWGYEADHPFDKEHQQLQKTGLPFEVVISTCCFASITGRWQNCQTQMLRGAQSGLKFGATGYHISEWGDMGHAQQTSMPIAGYIYGAALAWGVEDNQEIDVCDWLKLLYCPNEPQLSPYIIALQNVYLDAEITCPNCAFFGPLLFDQKSGRHIKHSQNLTRTGFDKATEQLKLMINGLCQQPDSYLRQQLTWSAETLRFACALGTELVKENTRDTKQLSVNSKQQLLPQLVPLIVEYERLWKIDNRIGGLQDSVSRLHYLQRLLQQ
ncbi:beta-N-acetylhexosaminidase [Psychromonas sp. psych-6C06]|uniref:family 20 glycosylhydrolase n=1 Tax=Psychromonas sp. psych-6C06 TaxID=2058089 RepID=UPI000C31F406|nr:family 20 glycosylhydrolase [Psychromonas sp. psych-6C06]PKF60400.1 beta-N-acetylhexosaminidase [Psychromonas sp. psych-6C06]